MSGFSGIALAANGVSDPLPINLSPSPTWVGPRCYALGLILTFSAGASLTATVQVTGDQFPSANGNWNDHDVLAGLTASANSNVAYPITGIRLVVTNYSGGSVNLGVAQWP